jgi:hypothetical protein
MGRGDDRLQAMRANPKADWRIQDVMVVCAAFGITCKPASGGSHCNVRHESQRNLLTIPARRPIKPIYIRRFVAFVDDVRNSFDADS